MSMKSWPVFEKKTSTSQFQSKKHVDVQLHEFQEQL